MPRSSAKPSALDVVKTGGTAFEQATDLTAAAAAVSFDWRSTEPVFDAVREEVDELREAWDAGSSQEIEHELGDVLLATCNLARHLGVDPEAALMGALTRFESRFRELERTAHAQGHTLPALDPADLQERWQAAKRALATTGGGA
ncbi:MAG: hypothetical protein KDA24_26825 [Deltaproteobacteria bacterium]|nr:hypothetical protein [Deltaproteobacteria bacterium]